MEPGWRVPGIRAVTGTSSPSATDSSCSTFCSATFASSIEIQNGQCRGRTRQQDFPINLIVLGEALHNRVCAASRSEQVVTARRDGRSAARSVLCKAWELDPRPIRPCLSRRRKWCLGVGEHVSCERRIGPPPSIAGKDSIMDMRNRSRPYGSRDCFTLRGMRLLVEQSSARDIPDNFLPSLTVDRSVGLTRSRG